MISPTGASAMPKFENLLWFTLQALDNLGGSASVREIEEEAISLARLSEAQQGVLHKGGPQTQIAYQLGWARSYLKAAGAVENSSRAVWSITERGRALGEADMRGIANQKGSSGEGHDVARDESGKRVAEESGSGERRWQELLLQILQDLPAESFEKLCQRVLRESGFTKVEVTGRSGDGGVDGLGVLQVSLLSFQVLFQCKRYKGSVGPSIIRDFRGAMTGRCDKGLVITTGSFTRDAIHEATRDGAPVLDLIDGEQLCRILKEKNLGVTTRLVEEVIIDSRWFASI